MPHSEKRSPAIVNLSRTLETQVQEVMKDDDFPVENFKLFVELAIYDEMQLFKEAKSSPSELSKFKIRLLKNAKSMAEKEWINKKLYGWKVAVQ